MANSDIIYMKSSTTNQVKQVSSKLFDRRYPSPLKVLPAINENCIECSPHNICLWQEKQLPVNPTQIFEAKMDPNTWVIIDVGGERFQAQREIFLGFPSTRLGKLMNADSVADILKYCEEFIPGDPPEFFFDRNPETFPGVLDMYRTGNFHFPEGGRSCAFVMRRDFQYWGLDELDMEACCALKYYPEIEVCR